VAEISVGSHSVMSQEAYLCAGHDYRDISFRFVSAPIRIAAECWIGARAFIGPGVDIGHASVVGAGSIVMKNVHAATIVAGNPAKLVGRRTAKIAAELWIRWHFRECSGQQRLRDAKVARDFPRSQ
jgi:putative colanic acid biosynthesis acetyltransferase WcaF